VGSFCLEPAPGIEPGTSALRKHCSTAELSWPGAGRGNRTPVLGLGSPYNNHYTIPANLDFFVLLRGDAIKTPRILQGVFEDGFSAIIGRMTAVHATPMIRLEGISKVYQPDVQSLRDISLAIHPGEFVSIVGQSGAGKTTLAKMLIAEERPSKGRIEIGGWDITRIAARDIPYLRRQIGVVFQDFKLLPKKTVYENVAFALEVASVPSKRIRDVVPQVLKIVGLDEKSHRFPRQLSGGEQQRVVVARSLVHRPKILLADEPTGNLDTINTQEIIDLLLKINAFGTTIVLVTHNREVVNALRRRVITLANGRVASDHAEGKYLIQ
jgi:cell division transport system ATP-binding protein